MKKVLAALLLISATLCAQDSRKAAVVSNSSPELFLGYTYQRTDSAGPFLNGNGGTAAFTYFVTTRVGLTAQGSMVTGKSGFHDYSMTFGPRLDLASGRLRPYIHFLVGYMEEQMISTKATSFGLQTGGGIDWNGNRRIGVRVIQMEYEHQSDSVPGSDSNMRLRISTGVNFRF